MNWTGRQCLALIWIIAVFVATFGVLLSSNWVGDGFWYGLTVPFFTASLLGIWLTAGSGPFWLRLLSVVVGQSLLIAAMMPAVPESPVSFTPGLAAATATTAMGTLALGCMGTFVPIATSWTVRIALWEVVASIGLLAIALGILRALSEFTEWNWSNWAGVAGVHFLVFSIFTGVVLTILLLTMVVNGIVARILSVVLVIATALLVPPLESWTFDALNLDGGKIELFYAAHTGHLVMGLAVMLPAILAFPGVLIRQAPAAEETTPQNPKAETETDFTKLQ